jgi:hypothetical protein
MVYNGAIVMTSELSSGELKFMNSESLPIGACSIFVSGKYNEVLKLYSWNSDKVMDKEIKELKEIAQKID